MPDSHVRKSASDSDENLPKPRHAIGTNGCSQTTLADACLALVVTWGFLAGREVLPDLRLLCDPCDLAFGTC